MFAVVGLGNPGAQYEGTRHNVGFRVLDKLAEDARTSIRRQEYLALTAAVRIGRSEVLLMKPQTYMNASGKSVLDACRSLAIATPDLVVVYDDVDLPAGRLRLRAGGGSGGHRGIRSLVEELGNSDFVRVRVGVGRPPQGVDTTAHVLAPFDAADFERVEQSVERAAEAVRTILSSGLKPAMDLFNRVIVPDGPA